MKVRQSIIAVLVAALVLPGCATRPENVTASHISSSRYADRTCKSLNREMDEVQDGLRASSAKLSDKANQDAVVTGVGIVLFWPVLFALGNNAGLEGEVARLKGEEQALKRALRDNNCERETPAVDKQADRLPASQQQSASAASPAAAR